MKLNKRIFSLKEKPRKISVINDLLNRTYLRTAKLREEYQKVRDEVFNQLTPNNSSNNERYTIIYEKDNTYLHYSVSKYVDSNGLVSYGISNGGEIKLEGRNEVIDFLTIDDKILELGNKYHHIYELLSKSYKSSYRVKASLNKAIDNYLYEKHLELYKLRLDTTIIIKIGKDKYSIKYDTNNYGYVINHSPIEITIKEK